MLKRFFNNISFSTLISLLLLNIKPAILFGEEMKGDKENFNLSAVECKKLKEDEMELMFQSKGGINFNIKVEMDKKLKKGMELLNQSNYEDSVLYFEDFLLTNSQILDQLFALSIISFTSFPSKAEDGAAYFKAKVKINHQDFLSAYYVGIFKILTLHYDQEGSEYLERAIESRLNLDKVHYMLGIAYRMEGKKELYLNECNLLEKKNTRLAERLKAVYSNSQAFQVYLKDITKKSLQQ